MGRTVRGRLASVTGRAVLLPLALAVTALSGPAGAQTLQEALAQAYTTNPQLEAQRAALRATDEQVPQALSNYRPNVEATGSFGTQETELSGTTTAAAGGTRTTQPRSLGVAVTQPIYRGGRTAAQVNRAENAIQAARATLYSLEQTILLNAATAYLDVVRDQATLELTTNNEQVIARQLEATRDRFRVGEVTRTDVSQSESRLAAATSNRIQSEGNLASSRAVYARIVGSVPGRLVQPRPSFALPASLQETIDLSTAANPSIISSQFVEAAARNAIDQVRGEALPSVSLRGSLNRGLETSTNAYRTDSGSVTAQVTVPLYQAGSVTSRVREATQTAGQRRIEIDQARAQIVETAIRAWQALNTSRASIQSRMAQVRAGEIALEGVRQEASVGSRTTLDVLDAEQELLNGRVGLVQSQRDELVAAFQVLSAIGQLGARQLNLPVQVYDVEENYRSVRDRW